MNKELTGRSVYAELISIGSELLSGRSLNTHAKELGGVLTGIGLRLVRDTTIPDIIEVIESAVRDALARVDLVFVSGGLGPTSDDMTREALSSLLKQKIVLHEATVKRLKGWYSRRGRTITSAGERQALVLENSSVLPNPVGASPGQRIDLSAGKTLFVLPGPPGEFNAILAEEIVPWLEDRYADVQPDLVRIVHTQGIGESDIVTLLEQAGFNPGEILLGFYPGRGRVEIHLTAGADKASDVDELCGMLRSVLADYLDPER
jgi:nicotinamide-nucleotide amidase